MHRKKKTDRPGRRRFLRGSAALGAGAAFATAAPATAVQLAGDEPAKNETRGYRMTEHIAAYYRTAAQ